MFVIGFLWILVIVLAYLLIIIFLPVMREPQFQTKKQAEESLAPENREEIVYQVEGDTIRGWLYLPEERRELVPCIILSHGFGGTKDALLEKYALRFNEAGYAALTYDYRHFGTSGGAPRQLFMATKQQEDLRGAISYARNRKEIDCERIVLWGTSASGGYGLVVASENPTIRGVIAQCPALDKDIDGKVALEREGWRFFLKLFVHAQRDRGRGRLGLSPHYIPIVGRPGETAMLTAPGAYEGYQEILLHSPTFQNRVCAQVLLTGQGENPSLFAAHVRCPTLILACEKDVLVSMESVEKVANIMGELCSVKTYPIDHFEIYEGEDFELAVEDMIQFLEEIL